MQPVLEQIIELFGVAAFAYFIAEGAAPIQQFKSWIMPDDDNRKFIVFFRDLYTCTMCLGFWVGLIYYENFLTACAVAIIAQLICIKVQPTINQNGD